MDNLEKLYKKSFEGFERKPNRQFWDKLEKEIPPKPEPSRNKIGYFFSFCMGLFVALFIIGYCWFMQDSEKIAVQSFKIPLPSNKKEEVIVIPDSSSKELQILLETQEQKKELFLSDSSILSIKKEVDVVVETTKYNRIKRIVTKDLVLANQEQVGRKERVNETEQIDNNRQPTRSISKRIAPISLLSIVRLDTLVIGTRQAALFKKDNTARKKKKILPTIQPYVAIQYTPLSIGKIQIKQATSSPSLITNATRLVQTKGGTATIGVLFPSNWLMEINVSHHQFLVESTTSQLITASFNSAARQELGYLQTYSFGNVSSIEAIKGTATVSSGLDVLQNGDLFGLTVLTQQALKFSSIMQQVGYQFKLHPRWQVLPKLGLSATWAKKEKIQATTFALSDERLQLVRSSLAPTNILKTNLIEGVLSTEIAYHHSKKLHFILTPQLRYGFQSFYNNSERALNNRFIQIQFGMRVQL